MFYFCLTLYSTQFLFFFFFFNDTATTEIYTLSLHDALPICSCGSRASSACASARWWATGPATASRSEEHTSELQSLRHLVCRLLLEKKKQWSFVTQCNNVVFHLHWIGSRARQQHADVTLR